MRIIAGQFRSRKLKSVAGTTVRPTPDRLRESLFSILAPQLENATFLDAYAGSGSVGLEALSRGAKHVFFIERAQASIAVLRDNIESLGVSRQCTVIRGKAAAILPQYSADIVFLDPPYDQVDEYTHCLTTLSESARLQLAIAQHSSRLQLQDRYGKLVSTRKVRQGDNTLTFFRPEPAPAEPGDQLEG